MFREPRGFPIRLLHVTPQGIAHMLGSFPGPLKPPCNQATCSHRLGRTCLEQHPSSAGSKTCAPIASARSTKLQVTLLNEPVSCVKLSAHTRMRRGVFLETRAQPPQILEGLALACKLWCCVPLHRHGWKKSASSESQQIRQVCVACPPVM